MGHERHEGRSEDMIGLFQYYRIGAAYLILLIHQQFWAKPIAVSRLTSVAVPLFAAMAGFLFANSLSRDDQVLPTLKKKVRRILVPYLIWAVIYWIANAVVLDGLIKHEVIVAPGVRSWLLGGIACHLWFMPCLFVTFVVFAVGGKVMGGKVIYNHVEGVNSSIRSVCSAWLNSTRLKLVVFDVAVLLLSALSQFIQDQTSATFHGYVKLYLGRLVFYFTVGHLLALIPVVNSVTASYIGWCLILLGLANVVFRWIEGLVWNPLLLVVGLIIVANGFRNLLIPKWVDRLAVASMGIYLVHVLFTSGANFALEKLGHSPLPAFMGFGLSVVLFAASYLVVRLLPKKCF